MDTPSVVMLLLVGLVFLLSFLGIRKRRYRPATGGSSPWPFYVKRLLSQPEQVLYHRLVKALPDHVVLAQVQVSRVLGVRKGFGFNEWNNRVNRLTYDFVICDKASTVIAAIELDDKSHESEHRIDTDAKKSKATTDAGLRLIRWHCKSLPDEMTIQREVRTNDVLPRLTALD
jgi:very-short-patch-repair endonuclease